jgi:signal transduction histidine kinase
MRLMRHVRAFWWLLALYLLVTFTIGTFLRYGDLLQICEASVAICGQTMRLRPSNLQGLSSPEAALQFYALFYTIEQTAVRLLLWTLAIFIFARRRDDWIALLASLWLLTYGPPFAEFAAVQRWPWLEVPLVGARMVSGVSHTLFLFLFPNGRFVPRWMRWVALGFIAFYLAGFVVPQWSTMPVAVPWIVFVPVLQYGIAFGAQVFRYRNLSTTVERLQTKWMVFGVALAGIFLLGTRLWTNLDPNVDGPLSASFYLQVIGFVLATIAIPITLGIAILRYRLFEIDIILNRALVYAALSACVVGAYVAIVGGLSALFRAQSDLLPSLLATGGIAIAFQPLRERVQRAVNRLMVGERDDPYGLLARLGQRLEGALEPAAALPLAVETVAQALKLPYVAVRLWRDGVLIDVAAHGSVRAEVVRWSLVHGGEAIGELVAAPRAPNEPLTAADRRLLADLARQISVAARATLLAADLEQARLRIVASKEEARRPLGSDLHDGVGHQLAGLARQTEQASALLERDPPAARALIERSTQQLNDAIALVRSLAHQLHPPELELLGLEGALRERVQSRAGLVIRMEAPQTLPRLPAAVETAAYYIALEALTNAEKHSEARTCRVRLALAPGDAMLRLSVLELDVVDDGRGLPAEQANGLGLLSMQARAAEVGGTCHIASAPIGGTRVSVRLPCPLEAGRATTV